MIDNTPVITEIQTTHTLDRQGLATQPEFESPTNPGRSTFLLFGCYAKNRALCGVEHVLEDSGDRALVRQVVNQSWLIPTYDYVFESLRRHYERIDVRLLEGNLKALDGETLRSLLEAADMSSQRPEMTSGPGARSVH